MAGYVAPLTASRHGDAPLVTQVATNVVAHPRIMRHVHAWVHGVRRVRFGRLRTKMTNVMVDARAIKAITTAATVKSMKDFEPRLPTARPCTAPTR